MIAVLLRMHVDAPDAAEVLANSVRALDGTPGLLTSRLRCRQGCYTLVTCWADLAAFERWMTTPWPCAEACAGCQTRGWMRVSVSDIDIVRITPARPAAPPLLDEAALCLGRPRGYG